jgi:dinuclear metal center YbgI/SA1388 family protein
MTGSAAIAAYLDDYLRTREIPDYAGALNGLQLANRASIHRAAAAVDFSRRTIEGAIREDANLLLVHHGMFWAGAQRIVGPPYDRLRLLIEHDIAVYSSHLPLDAHPECGNNVLLARALGLEPSGTFARYQTVAIGVQGRADVATDELIARAERFARERGGQVVAAGGGAERRTRRWAICTGAGASSETIREALDASVDTLIVGEGPHHTAVEARDAELTVIYAGHYATETLGVSALARHVGERYDVPWVFIDEPTGL